MRDPIRKAKFTVVSAATHRTQYVRGLTEQIEALRQFEIPFVYLTYEPKESWEASAKNKPHQIKRARQIIDGPIFWLDADARLMQYPSFLDTLDPAETDICVSRRWPSAPSHKLAAVAAGGCFWLSDSDAATDLLDEWIERCDKSGPKEVDDVILTHILNASQTIREARLPDEYLAIEGLCPWDKSDIVRHLQYSRTQIRVAYESYH